MNDPWNESTDFPEELSKAENGLSVDVLIYSISMDQHTVGWFDFVTMTWRFLCREPQDDFKWRYFNKKTDNTK
jgi:hypothetical protein